MFNRSASLPRRAPRRLRRAKHTFPVRTWTPARGQGARNRPRPFERQFDLADYVEVTGATMGEGLLVIELKREIPEALKPRRIPINAGVVLPRDGWENPV